MPILDGLKLLESLSDSERENLSMFCQPKHIEAGEVLFREDEEATAMYILKEGDIEVTRELDGEKVVLGEVHAEEILGEMALFNDTNKRMATATAINDCTLIVILSFSIKELTKNHPELLNKIRTIINDRLVANKNVR